MMVGRFGEQGFDELEAERDGTADEFGVVVAGPGGAAAAREGVAELVDGVFAWGAAGEEERSKDERRARRKEVLAQRRRGDGSHAVNPPRENGMKWCT